MKSKIDCLQNHIGYDDEELLRKYPLLWHCLQKAMEEYAAQFQQPVKNVGVLVEALKECIVAINDLILAHGYKCHPKIKIQRIFTAGERASELLRQYESTEPVGVVQDNEMWHPQYYNKESKMQELFRSIHNHAVITDNKYLLGLILGIYKLVNYPESSKRNEPVSELGYKAGDIVHGTPRTGPEPLTTEVEEWVKTGLKQYDGLKSDAMWNANELIAHCKNSFANGARAMHERDRKEIESLKIKNVELIEIYKAISKDNNYQYDLAVAEIERLLAQLEAKEKELAELKATTR